MGADESANVLENDDQIKKDFLSTVCRLLNEKVGPNIQYGYKADIVKFPDETLGLQFKLTKKVLISDGEEDVKDIAVLEQSGKDEQGAPKCNLNIAEDHDLIMSVAEEALFLTGGIAGSLPTSETKPPRDGKYYLDPKYETEEKLLIQIIKLMEKYRKPHECFAYGSGEIDVGNGKIEDHAFLLKSKNGVDYPAVYFFVEKHGNLRRVRYNTTNGCHAIEKIINQAAILLGWSSVEPNTLKKKSIDQPSFWTNKPTPF